MTQDELRELLKEEVKGLTTKLTVPTDYDNAIDNAELETWTLPQTSGFRIIWLKRRAKRHLYNFLLSETSNKFKVKDKFLNQKFDHYLKLVKWEDEQFEKAQTDDAHEFADVSSVNLFGTKIDAGFAYQDQTGIDVTYSDGNEVISAPNDNS